MSSYKCQEEGATQSHRCVLIYGSGTEGDGHHAPGSDFMGLTAKVLKVQRLEEVATCHDRDHLEKMALFPCVEVEKMKCFLEESSSEQDSGSGNNEAKGKVWSYPNQEEMAPVKGKGTSAPTERSSQKNQPSSDKEKVNKPHKENAEKTNTSLVQRSLSAFHTKRPQGEVEDFALRKSIEPRGNIDRRDILCSERLHRQGKNSAGDDKHASEGENERPVLRTKGNGLHSKEHTREREPEEEEGSSAANETVMDTCSNKKQNAAQADGAQPRERQGCVSSGRVISTSRVLGKPALGPLFQKAEQAEQAGCGKRRGPEERAGEEGGKKSRAQAGQPRARPGEGAGSRAGPGPLAGPTPGVRWNEGPRQQDLATPLGDGPAPPAPFHHRIVVAKQTAVNSLYTVSRTEILGGGRFGQVHKCEEKATGLKLAAKVIKTRDARDKDSVRNEIAVMNQLDHVNLIQLYDAFESKNDIVLVMEYVEGGELFDRIIDDNYNLTELDTILFIEQICEGIRHMHQMYILHLDLKPENILCVNRDAKQIKIIDFGLARRYKPREKLKVNFGTPEFLAPEVVNYDFVSFPTDMWSVGVIAYMLLSGLSPFLGDNDAETLSNILACRWDLEEEEFQNVSEEAKEFISKLLIKEKSWRISASEALKHPWLSDHKLRSRLRAQEKKNYCSDAQDLVAQ